MSIVSWGQHLVDFKHCDEQPKDFWGTVGAC